MNKKLREEVYKKYDGHCGYCGEEIELKNMQVDHIIPKRNFPQVILNAKHNNTYKQQMIPKFLEHLEPEEVNHIDNLMPSCRVCNLWKSANWVELFRSEIFEQVNRLNKYSSNYRMAKKYKLVQENTMPIKFYYEKVSEQNV